MADIRIKDITTTAAASSADDYIAIDGATNGTRKLSAATPSFTTSVTAPVVVASGSDTATAVNTGGFKSANFGLSTASGGANVFGGGIYSNPSAGTWAVLNVRAAGASDSAVLQMQPSGTLSSSNPLWNFGHRFSAHGPLSIWRYDGAAHQNNTVTIAASSGDVSLASTTSASSSTVGALTIGNGAPATSVGIGGGNVAIGGSLIVATQTPASAAAAGVAGTIAWDSSYIYVCTATNTWKRVAIATW